MPDLNPTTENTESQMYFKITYQPQFYPQTLSPGKCIINIQKSSLFFFLIQKQAIYALDPELRPQSRKSYERFNDQENVQDEEQDLQDK